MDVDGDNVLSFTEFAAGMLLVFKDTLAEQLHDVFESYDRSGDNTLDVVDAKDFLEAVFAVMDQGAQGKSEAILAHLLKARNSDGKITYEQAAADRASTGPDRDHIYTLSLRRGCSQGANER